MGSAPTPILSIGTVGFMVGDDIHLVMQESVGDIIAGISQGGCVVLHVSLSYL
jgi:hypothetical protein